MREPWWAALGAVTAALAVGTLLVLVLQVVGGLVGLYVPGGLAALLVGELATTSGTVEVPPIDVVDTHYAPLPPTMQGEGARPDYSMPGQYDPMDLPSDEMWDEWDDYEAPTNPTNGMPAPTLGGRTITRGG